jgi:pimeloyl-ACP methyl ester carboxylesterase
MRRPIVLVPGACLGGWAWRHVAGALRTLGHDVYPVTLTGLGERVHLARPEVDLETHIADVVNLLDYEGLEDAVLLGHSYAGIVITGVADRRAERLNAVVYLDCSPIPAGMTIADVQSPEQREQQLREVNEHGDGWRWPLPDRATLARGTFGSAVGLEDAHLDLVAERGTPQPYATFTSPLELTRSGVPDVRRVAIFCADGGIDLATLRDLIGQGDPRAAMFADPDWELHELATGHWPMFSQPDALTTKLHDIAST